jgi:hypothetical protein
MPGVTASRAWAQAVSHRRIGRDNWLPCAAVVQRVRSVTAIGCVFNGADENGSVVAV